MNENDLKWIAVSGLDLNPFNICLSEKLESFGWCVDFSGFGEGKADKAQLCIFEVLNRKEKPNIMIICSGSSSPSWYNSLLMGLGLDFKYLSGARDAVMYYSPELSNLFIVSEDVIADSANNSVLNAMKNDNIVWDLIIADTSESIDGINTALYTENVGMKAERVLVFAPTPASYKESPDSVKDIVKALLNKDADVSAPINADTMKFTMDTPYLNYPDETDAFAEIKPVYYSFSEKAIPSNLHIEEMQSGIRYSAGGNVFEEYNLPERKLYLKPSYTRAEAEILKNTDKKLEAFLKIIDEVMNDSNKTAIVYFETDATLNYVEKILSAIYYDKFSSIAVFLKNNFDAKRLKQWYEALKEQPVRVVLAKDNLDDTFGIYNPITHIINYELPDNPVLLHQRFKRRVLMGGANPEFVIFCDENGIFDSRILKKVLAGNLYKAFRRELAGENVLFRVRGADKFIADMLADIKYIADYTGAVGSSFDVISRFKLDYNIPAARNLTTAAKTNEYSIKKLGLLVNALGVRDIVAEKEINKEALLSAVSAKVDEIKNGFTYFDENMALKTVPRHYSESEEYKKFAGFLSGNPYLVGVERAKTKLKEMTSGKDGFVYVKSELSGLSDSMKASVIYNIWRYWHKELGLGGSYDEMIKAYNEGVI
ncbi:MAG: hypothetical protein IJX15_08145 [Ruminiclostridium sp.]|nr:hypothetical protein [Ruminiclostridium sp.]